MYIGKKIKSCYTERRFVREFLVDIPSPIPFSLGDPSSPLAFRHEFINVHLSCLEDDPLRILHPQKFVYLHDLILILLIILKEAANLGQTVLWQIRNVRIIPKLWVISVHSNDFIVLLSLIHHPHDANGLGTEEREGNHGLLHQNQDIQGVVVFTVGARDEAIVVGVHHRGVKYPIDVEKSRGFIELVFNFRSTWNFDNCGEIKGGGRVWKGVEGWARGLEGSTRENGAKWRQTSCMLYTTYQHGECQGTWAQDPDHARGGTQSCVHVVVGRGYQSRLKANKLKAAFPSLKG